MKISMFAACLVLAAVPAFAWTSAQPDLPDSSFDWKAAQPVLVVAEVSVGGDLPVQTLDCPKDRVCISMDAPPYWLQLDEASELYGEQVPARFAVKATDHYGSSQFQGRAGPFLVALMGHNGRYMKQRNAHARLVKSKNGTLYLLRSYPSAPRWLPCNVDAIREHVVGANFDETSWLDREDYDRLRVDERAYYTLSAKGAIPRYAIALPRLREFLDTTARARLPLTCPEPD